MFCCLDAMSATVCTNCIRDFWYCSKTAKQRKKKQHQNNSCILSSFLPLPEQRSCWVSPWMICRWLIVILSITFTRHAEKRLKFMPCSVSPGRLQVWYIGRTVVECCRGNTQEAECAAAASKDRLWLKNGSLLIYRPLFFSMPFESTSRSTPGKMLRVVAPCRFLISAPHTLTVPAKRQTRTCCKLFQQRPPQSNPTDTGPRNHGFVSS